MYSNTKNSPCTIRWAIILDVISDNELAPYAYKEIGKVYFDQWVNATHLDLLLPKLSYKIQVVFKNTQNMETFIRSCLLSALDECQPDDHGVVNNYTKLDRFTLMIISCSFNWIQNPEMRKFNSIEDSQVLDIISSPEILDKYFIQGGV